MGNSRQNASVSASPTSMADDLAAAGLVDGVGDHHALALNAAAGADLLDLRVDEQMRETTLQRALAKRVDLLIEQAGDPADVGLAATPSRPRLPS